MWQAGVLGVGFATSPDFVQQESAGLVNRTVQIIAYAAFFFARGTGQGAEFRLQQRFLAFAGAQDHDERDGILREPLVSP